MEKKQLPFMSKLEKRQYKKWNSLNVNVAKRLTPTRDINQGRVIVSAAVEEELHEIGYMPSTLPKEIFTEENDNRQGSNTKKSYAEILENAKPKGIVKVVNTESH